MAPRAGHDINYIALPGALHTYGRKDEKPSFPVNAVGDFGGGGMLLAFGVVAGDSGFRVAAYDVFGGTSGGIAGSSAQTARRAGGLTHDESFFLLLNGDTAGEISVLWDKLAVGSPIMVVGFGKTETNAMNSTRMQVARTIQSITSNQFIYDQTDMKGACQADSGGPATWVRTARSGTTRPAGWSAAGWGLTRTRRTTRSGTARPRGRTVTMTGPAA